MPFTPEAKITFYHSSHIALPHALLLLVLHQPATSHPLSSVIAAALSDCPWQLYRRLDVSRAHEAKCGSLSFG